MACLEIQNVRDFLPEFHIHHARSYVKSLALAIPGILTVQLLWVQKQKTTEAKNITKTLVRMSNTHKELWPRIAYACS